MGKKWFSSKELTAIDGLPSTTQGINRRARIEKWQRRQREGIQGKAFEYHIDSLPQFVRNYFLATTCSWDETPLSATERRAVWLAVYAQLSPEEQRLILSWLWRNGLESLLTFIARDGNDTPI